MDMFFTRTVCYVMMLCCLMMLCALLKAWERYRCLNIDLQDIVAELREIKYSYVLAGRKLSAKQTKFVEAVLLKRNYYTLSDEDRKVVDFYKNQMMGTGQYSELVDEGDEDYISFKPSSSR